MLDRRTTAAHLAALCLCALAGCIVPEPSVEPREADTQVPESYRGATDAENSAGAAWSDFFDPELGALIDLALRNNQELHILSLEIEIARNEAAARRGEVLPRVDFGAGLGVEKVGETTSQGAADAATGVPEHLPDYSFGLAASWEVDVWKKLRNATQAATLRMLAGVEGRRFAVTRLVAEIADSWYELLALDSQLDVLAQNVAIQQDALEVIRLQKQAGQVTELAVQRFEAEVLKNRSLQFSIQQRILETENRINFLVGRFPQPIARSSAGFIALVPRTVQPGLPSQLLENRPDVRQAELELEAAKLDVAVAKARFYPTLELRAGLGYESYRLGHLTETPESTFWGLMAEVVAPILNRSAIEAAYSTASAVQMQAVHAYERTILGACAEVSNQLAMIENLDQSFALRSREVERLVQSIEISTGLFTSARADYMEVLLTRRDALDAQMELIETKQRRLAAMVDLYQALGGGWRTPPQETAGGGGDGERPAG